MGDFSWWLNFRRPEFFDDTYVEDVALACTAVPTGVESEPRPEVVDTLAHRALVSAVVDLPERMRYALLARVVDGATNETTARVLGVTRQRVDQLVDLAIERLRKRPQIVEVLRGRPLPRPVRPSAVALSPERVRLINGLMAKVLGRAPAPVRRQQRREESARTRAWRRASLAAKRDRVRLVIAQHMARSA
jgi:hypothetical protein